MMKHLNFFFLSFFLMYSGLYIEAQPDYPLALGSSNDDEGYSLCRSADNHLILACAFTQDNSTDRDLLVVKMDLSGNTVWSHTFGGPDDEFPRALIESSDSGLIILGGTTSFGYGGEDIFVLKLDQNGTLQWSKAYGSAGEENGFSLRESADGSLILGGSTRPGSDEDQDAFVIKVNPTGELEWSRSIGGSLDDSCLDIKPLPDGSFIFTGTQSSYGAGASDLWLVKVSNSGEVAWAKAYGGSADEHSSVVQLASDGGFIMLGHTRSWGAGDWDLLLVKTDEAGEKQWSRVYGAAREDISGDLMPLEEAYYLAAYSSSFGDDPDLLILKTDQQGTPEWSKNIELPGSDIIPLGAQQAILPFDDQNIFLTGRIAAGPLGGSDIFLQRFSAQGESECLGDFVDLQSEDPPVSSTNLFVTAVESGEAHPGSFSVNLFELESATLCFPPLALFSTSDTLVCAGECLSFTDESKYKPVSWSWTFPGGDPATSLEQNPEGICFEEPGLYTIQLITDNDLGSDTAFQSIQVLGEPAIDLGADTLLCQDDILMLDASSPGLTYLWQDGSSEASLAATAPGLYWVVVSNAACTASDTIEIDLFPPIVLQSLGEDTSLCRGEELLLKLEAENVQQQIWSTLEEGPEILVTETGSYSVTVSNLCESLDSDPVEVTFENCDCSFSVPNIFSPNADGLNDGFRPVTDCKVLEYKLSVFDRWGGVIFETRTFEEAWDGKSGNQPVDPDVYVYLIEVVYSQNRQIQRASLSGDLLLVR